MQEKVSDWGSKGHKLSEYIKLNDKPKRRTRKYKRNLQPWALFNDGDLGRVGRETRYDW